MINKITFKVGSTKNDKGSWIPAGILRLHNTVSVKEQFIDYPKVEKDNKLEADEYFRVEMRKIKKSDYS